jgi:hypothetical protein
VYCERYTRQDDAFPAIAVVESAWRELSGMGDERAFQADSIPLIEQLRADVTEAGHPSAVAVKHALDAVLAVARYGGGERAGAGEAKAAALAVAGECDRHELPPPIGWAGWVEYEAAGTAAWATALSTSSADLTPARCFDFRMEAGAESMNYRRAMQEWLHG